MKTSSSDATANTLIRPFSNRGLIGLLATIISLLLLVPTFSQCMAGPQRDYLTAAPAQSDSRSATMSELFQLPVFPSNYLSELPFPFLLQEDTAVIYTQSCEAFDEPEKLMFVTPRTDDPKKIHILMNLRRAFTELSGGQLAGQRVGAVALEFDTPPGTERFVYLDVVAGRDIREWLIGESQEPHVTTITSPNTHEVYYGFDNTFGLRGVIDLVTLDVPASSPNDPLVGVWILDASMQEFGHCDPGFQVFKVIVEAPHKQGRASE